MKVEEYLGQGENYFSESQGNMVAIDSMPLPYLLNCYLKLHREFEGEFSLTVLERAMSARLFPSLDVLVQRLRQHGNASVYAYNAGSRKAARSRMYRAGKRLGRKVATKEKGQFIEGTCEPDPTPVVNVRPVRKTVSNRFAGSR